MCKGKMVENLFHMDGLVTLQACLKAKINLSRFFTFDDVMKWYKRTFLGFNILNIVGKNIEENSRMNVSKNI